MATFSLEELAEPAAALSAESFPILAARSQRLDEIADVEAWVRGRHGRPRKPAATGYDLTIDIGTPSTSPPTSRHVVVGPDRPGRALLTALLELWKSGTRIDWTPLHQPFERLDLPAYPFDRSRHWIPLGRTAPAELAQPVPPSVEGLLYARHWSRSIRAVRGRSGEALVIGEAEGLGPRLATHLGARHARDVRAALDASRERAPQHVFLLTPAEAAWAGWSPATAEERLVLPALDLVRALVDLRRARPAAGW